MSLDDKTLEALRVLKSQLPEQHKKLSAGNLLGAINPGAQASTLRTVPLPNPLTEAEMERVAELIKQLCRTDQQSVVLQVEQELLRLEHSALVMALGHAGRLFQIGAEPESGRMVALCTAIAARDGKARRLLLDCLQDTQVSRRRLSALVLGHLRESEAVTDLRRLLEDPECWYEAAIALLDLQDPDSAPALAAAIGRINPLNKADSRERGWRIAQRMASLGYSTIEPLLQEYLKCTKRPIRNLLGRAIVGFKELAVDALANILRDEDETLAGDAAMALGKIGTERAAEHLLQAIEERRNIMRTLLEALGRVRHQRSESAARAIEVLTALVFDEALSPHIRGSALISLGNLAAKDALPVIAEAQRRDLVLDADGAMARARAGDATGTQRLWELAAAGRGYDMAVRYLGGLGDQAQATAVETLISTDHARTLAAARVLTRFQVLKADSVTAILARLQTADDALRSELYRVLANQRPMELYRLRDLEKVPRLQVDLQRLIDNLPKQYGKPSLDRG